MKYRIALFDKNTSNKVSESILNDIKLLREKGIKVGVCSMRTVKYCKEVVPIDLDFYICLNGSVVVCDKHIVVDIPLNMSLNSIDFLTYGLEKSYYSTFIAKKLASESGFIAQERGIASSIYNLVLFNIEEYDLKEYNSYHYEYWPLTKTLMLQDKYASKVNGIGRVLQYYHINPPILYFGDGPNDLDIFKNYSDCVCMGSCFPSLEQYALFKTETCQNNGIEKALRKLKLL